MMTRMARKEQGLLVIMMRMMMTRKDQRVERLDCPT